MQEVTLSGTRQSSQASMYPATKRPLRSCQCATVSLCTIAAWKCSEGWCAWGHNFHTCAPAAAIIAVTVVFIATVAVSLPQNCQADQAFAHATQLIRCCLRLRQVHPLTPLRAVISTQWASALEHLTEYQSLQGPTPLLSVYTARTWRSASCQKAYP